MTQDNNDALMSEKEKLLAEIRADYGEETEIASGNGTVSDDGFEDISSTTENVTATAAAPEEYYPTDEELEESISPSPVITKVSKPLPKYGPGFKFVPITVGVTIVAVILGHIKPITSGIPSASWLRYTYIALGVILAILGIKLIVDALVNSALNENLQMGKLITTGIYSKTRNPVYGGVLFLCTAALFFSGNAFMYILPILYWVFLTKLMEATEEVLLNERFDSEYRDYCTRTYRFVPIPKK